MQARPAEESGAVRAEHERPARKARPAPSVETAPSQQAIARDRRPEHAPSHGKAPARQQPVRQGGEPARKPAPGASSHPFGGDENIPAFLRG
jgi:hypothetical protein